MRIRPGQVWTETQPADPTNPQHIVIYGIAPNNGDAYYVSADPNQPAEKAHCRFFAFWPHDSNLPETGKYRLVADAPDDPMVRAVRLISVEYARAWAAHVLQQAT